MLDVGRRRDSHKLLKRDKLPNPEEKYFFQLIGHLLLMPEYPKKPRVGRERLLQDHSLHHVDR